MSIYVCGITTYDVCHIGHARASIVFDVIVRHLRHRGYKVNYIKNFTDVDDKIIARAIKEDLNFNEISERYIKMHNEDMALLGVETPTLAPRATDHIEDMISLINLLMEKGFAYQVDGDVYFAVNNYSPYGSLSGRHLDEMIAGARIEVNDRKRNPLDFALWKAAKDGEPYWESPWGNGRPGWHIECSAMSRRYLGETFDIHGGGEDLVFPHHENESAQSQAATGLPLANYWIHNAFVKINSEKMSKSLGNIFSVREILENYQPEVLRLFMLQSHYRSPVDYSDSSLLEARQALIRCYLALQLLKETKKNLSGSVNQPPDDKIQALRQDIINKVTELKNKFDNALDDDFNTAKGLGYVFEAVRIINNYLASEKNRSSAGNEKFWKEAQETFGHFGNILGIFKEDPDAFFAADKKIECRKRKLDEAQIEALVKSRNEARAARNWARADEIRSRLAELEVVIKDFRDGTVWSIE